MNAQVRTSMTDSQRQNPNSQCVQVKPQRGRRLLGMASSWLVRVAPPGSKRLDQNSSRAVAKHVGEAQHHRIKQQNTRTEPGLTESTGEKRHERLRNNNSHAFRTVPDAPVNRGTDELWRCSHRVQDHRGVNDSASRSDEMSDKWCE